MTTTASQHFGDLLTGAFGLKLEAFQDIITFADGLSWALLVVLLAGLSLGFGQSIILFINRVKPSRFIFSLLLNTVLFTFSFLFWVGSTWLIGQLPWSVSTSFYSLVKVLGLGYAPLLFSFLGALPYAGVPILNFLSVWQLLAVVVGFSAAVGVTGAVAFGYVAFGWFILQLLKGSIGKPIAKLGQALSDRIAGVKLAKNRSELRERVNTGLEPIPSGRGPVPSTPAPQINQLIQSARRSHPQAAQAVAEAVTLNSGQLPTPIVQASGESLDPWVALNRKTRNIPQQIRWLVSIMALFLLFGLIALLLHPIKESVFGWYNHIPTLFRYGFDLVWIGVVAIVFAGILAPLETLGWWAGWYGEEVETYPNFEDQANLATVSLSSTPNSPQQISRYLIYLDGIGQSGTAYTPDIMDFLNALQVVLPKDVELIQGLMMYSVLNKPLDEDRPLAFFWRLADKTRWTNPASFLGLILNLRNVFIVGVSADKRYGPIYNQGIAQILHQGLLQRGYQPGSGIPITLLGYSGGGEMSAASAPYLKRTTGAPIEVISLGGVISANNNFLKLEHLYHLYGEKDSIQRLGSVLFPGRWQCFPLSYWNRAKRLGKISFLSMGAVGHQVPGGYMDPNALLQEGPTHLQQTIQVILSILRGEVLTTEQIRPRKISNYALYQEAPFTQPSYYPLDQKVDLSLYQPIGPWMGRLILPQQALRSQIQGVLLEVHHAPEPYQDLVGQVVNLRWANDPLVKKTVTAITRDVHFSAEAEYSSKYGGNIHPDRINHWRQVNPLESLAGARPVDDVVVFLGERVDVVPAETDRYPAALYIYSLPVQVTGRYYGLVQFLQPVSETEFLVVHFNRLSRQFDGTHERVLLPSVRIAQAYGSYPSTSRDLEKSPLNELGWYIYGAKNAAGIFVVQALAPRALLRLQPDEVVLGQKASYTYIRKRAWIDPIAAKGRITSVLCDPTLKRSFGVIQDSIDEWQEGDRALLLHTYGGIGGEQKEPAAATPLFFGHFAYGLAKVIRDPLADELRFDIRYYQVYTQNTDGLIAGSLHWSRYMGDRQFGWLGTRPTCDILLKLECFSENYEVNQQNSSPLTLMLRQLEVMTARYRIGDGTGATFVGPANNCSQDSNQALFASIQQITQLLQGNPPLLQAIVTKNPKQSQRFRQLQRLGKELQLELQPLGGPRSDWEKNEFNLGSTLEDNPLQNLWIGLGSWRTMLPRLASDTIVRIFLNHGAKVWVLRTNQVGGNDPNIEPIAPLTL
jgi:predicted Abi (CAAX) family protease